MAYQIKPLKGMKKEEPRAGERLARLLAKKGMIEGRTVESQGVLIPVVSLAMLNGIVADTAGQQWLRGKVQDVQDGLIRRLIGAGKVSFFDDQIGMDAVLKVMAADMENTRFSKESIKVWFDTYQRVPLFAALAAKAPAAQGSVITKLCDQFLECFQTLSGKNVSMDLKTKDQLLKAIELLPEDHESATASELLERLQEASETGGIAGAL